MEVLKKIYAAQDKVRKADKKKKGRNDYSNYDYYTPEQVDELVWKPCREEGLFNKVYMQMEGEMPMVVLDIIDLDSGEKETYVMPIGKPKMTASNQSQEFGAALTYGRRYLLMGAYNIIDNEIDPDNNPASKSKKDKIELKKHNKDGSVSGRYNNVVKAILGGRDIQSVKEYYVVSSELEKTIEEDVERERNTK